MGLAAKSLHIRIEVVGRGTRLISFQGLISQTINALHVARARNCSSPLSTEKS